MFVYIIALSLAIARSWAASGIASSALESLTPQCQDTVVKLISSDDPIGNCVYLSDFIIPVASASGDPKFSFIPAVDTWLGDLCSKPECSSDVVNSYTEELLSSCSQDIQASKPLPVTAKGILSHFTDFRAAVCFKDGSQYCPTEILTSIEKSSQQPINNDLLGAIATKPETVFNQVNKNSYCNSCGLGMISKLHPAVQAMGYDSAFTSAVTNTCGADYLNGTVPAQLTASTKSSAVDLALKTSHYVALGSVAMLVIMF